MGERDTGEVRAESPRFPHYGLVPKDLQGNLKFRHDLLKHGASSRRAAEEVWLMCARDLLFYTNAVCWLFEPRSRARLPFITYDFQDDAFRVISDALGYNDLVVEKSRDMGASWMCVVAYEHAWHFHDNSTFLMLSRKEELVDGRGKDPKSLFAKIDFLHRYQSHWLKPKFTRMNMQLSNEDNDSSIDGESTNKFAGVADRRYGILLDEFSKMDNADVIFRGTRDVSDSRLFNYTPEGAGNMAHAIAHKPEFRKLTLHWHQHPLKSIGLYRVPENGEVEFIDTNYWTPAMKAKKGAFSDVKPDNPRFDYRSPWYDAQCRRAFNLKEIAQELDIDYLGSSYQFFSDVHRLGKAIKRTIPGRRGDISYSAALAEPAGFTPLSGGLVELWATLDPTGNPPIHGKRYVIGADISAGTGASNSVLVIGEAHSRHQVAEIATPHMRPDEFAVLAVSLCKWFGNAHLIWEAPGPGRGFSSKVKDLGYGNVYFFTGFKWRGAKTKKQPGWHPTKDEKRELFEEYRRAVYEGDFLVQSRLQLEECRHFVFKPGGWIEHTGQSGGAVLDPSGARENHGDRPTAGALCWKRMVELVPHALTAPKDQTSQRFSPVSDSPHWSSDELPVTHNPPDGSIMARRLQAVRRRQQQLEW